MNILTINFASQRMKAADMCSMAKKRKNEKKSFRRSADTYDILLFAFVEPQLPEHLVALFHHQGSLVGVRRDIAIHL